MNAKTNPNKLSYEFRRLATESTRHEVTLGELMHVLGDRGHAFLALFLALPFVSPIPVPGLSTAFGIIIALIGVAITLDRDPWLPKKIRNRPLPGSILKGIFQFGEKVFQKFEVLFKPRILVLTEKGWSHRLAGFLIALSAVILALPLPPGTNFPPALVILSLSIGLLERDGVLMVLGYLLFVVKITAIVIAVTVGVNGVKKMIGVDAKPEFANVIDVSAGKPLIFGHRGASGHTPEHTLYSYELAIQMGADYYEPDLVATKDGVLIARHENEISETTDVAEKFPDRKTKKTIDGTEVEGFFTEDFTLSEIKTLRARERLIFRSKQDDGKYEIPTFTEILEMRDKLEKKFGRTVGIVPEIKHSTYFRKLGVSLEDAVVKELQQAGLDRADAPVALQSFEIANLVALAGKTKVSLVQLLGAPEEIPFDVQDSGGRLTYSEMATDEGLKKIANYAKWVSPPKAYIFSGTTKSDFVERAHAVGLKVVPYTFRNEPMYLPRDEQGVPMDPEAEYRLFFAVGVDAVFSDFPDTAAKARLLLREEN